MERLTYTDKISGMSVPSRLKYDKNMNPILNEDFIKIVKKLAYYEELAESGRLPSLYIGCDVYFRVKRMNQFGAYVDFIQTQKIERIDIDINGILYCTASVKFIISDVGKSVFLTRDEAEEKLKGGGINERI